MPAITVKVQSGAEDVHILQDGTGYSQTASNIDCRSSTTNPASRGSPGLVFDIIAGGHSAIPQGSTVNSCTVSLAGAAAQLSYSLDAHIEDNDQPVPYPATDVGDTPLTRPRTGSVVYDFTSIVDDYVATPDMSALMQTVVDRAGFTGLTVGAILRGSTRQTLGTSIIQAFENNPAFAAKLDLDYTEPAAAGGSEGATDRGQDVGNDRGVD